MEGFFNALSWMSMSGIILFRPHIRNSSVLSFPLPVSLCLQLLVLIISCMHADRYLTSTLKRFQYCALQSIWNIYLQNLYSGGCLPFDPVFFFLNPQWTLVIGKAVSSKKYRILNWITSCIPRTL